MTQEKPIAKYSFLPWLRQGLAASIQRPDNPAHAGAANPRAEIGVDAALSVGGPVHKQVELHGPGDVTHIDLRAIVRTDPRHGTNDFEPNYLPLIEFYDEDFPWRYTPASAAAHERLRPWICLVTLARGEFSTGAAPKTRLLTIQVNDPSVSLPNPQETWGWAHGHVARDVKGADGSAAQVLSAVRATLAADSSQAISRLVCPRRLRPNQTYYAMVIPTFETGRLAGLGQDIPAGINGLAPAWGQGQDTFPVYYMWEFHTGELGDFEYLVELLQPRAADERVGKRPMDVQTPAPDYNIPPVTPPVLELEGALKAINMASTPWPEREPFLSALTGFLNLPDDLKLDGSGAVDDPLVAPPIYGQWPAGVERVNQPGGPPWLNTLNLDPRNRTAAGFGTRVVQNHQEEYMDIAWRQVGALREANRKLRAAQIARFLAGSLYRRHLIAASRPEAFVLTANLHSRVLVEAPEIVAGPLTTGGPTAAAPPAASARPQAISVQALTRQSRLPSALASPGFRRAVRPRGPVQKRGLELARGRRRAHGAAEILARVERGELTPAPPKPAPEGGIVLETVLGQVAPRRPAGCLLAPPVVTLLRLAAAALRLLRFLPGVSALSGWLDEVLERIRQAQVLSPAQWTPQQIDRIPPMPNFELTQPGDPLPAGGVGGSDSHQAARFKAALKEQHALYAASLQPAPARPALRVSAVTRGILEQIEPGRTIAARVKANIRFEKPSAAAPTPTLDPLDELLIAPDFPQPMYVPLRDISKELLLPNVDLIPPNTITLLKTNQKFIEAYLVGLNHEMAREFIWREYPTDQRSTYFRQFWAARESNPRPGLSPQARAERLKDIFPIHLWPRANDLGANNRRKPGPDGEFLVLLIRGDLFRRYPHTEVYAAKAVWHDPPLQDPGSRCELLRTPESDEFFGDDTKIRKPIFDGDLGPEIRYFGFDLDEATARGDPANPSANPGWFFALREHPGEPRFGLDEPEALKPVSTWKELTWANVAGSLEAVDELDYIRLANPLTQVAVGGSEGSIAFEAGKGANAATLAYILLQDPYKAYMHAAEMLPPVS